MAMRYIMQSLKVVTIAIITFMILTFCLAAVIKYTPFSEEWGKTGLTIILTITLITGCYLEGYTIGKRGVLTGVIVSVLLLALILIAVRIMFMMPVKDINFKLEYLVPIVLGTVASIAGTNNRK